MLDVIIIIILILIVLVSITMGVLFVKIQQDSFNKFKNNTKIYMIGIKNNTKYQLKITDKIYHELYDLVYHNKSLYMKRFCYEYEENIYVYFNYNLNELVRVNRE